MEGPSLVELPLSSGSGLLKLENAFRVETTCRRLSGKRFITIKPRVGRHNPSTASEALSGPENTHQGL